jgi:ADP-ribose pyrophosphatase YjhB (NUDIX family)
MEKEVICTDINGKEYKVPVSKLAFRPSVYGVIIENEKVLLSKQWDGYDFPGGGMDLGETIEESLKREIKEETGLEVKVGKVVACENSFFKLPHREDKFVHSILIYYLCERTGGELSTANFDEHEKEYADMPEWIDINDVKKIKFYNSVGSVKIIKEAIKL